MTEVQATRSEVGTNRDGRDQRDVRDGRGHTRTSDTDADGGIFGKWS